jgi:Listeria/Bacterioides repeat
MKKNKKRLSWVMILTMIVSMTTGMQTAWATGAGGTITSASELYAGEEGYDKAVITLENDTFSSTVSDVGVEIDGAVTTYDFMRNSDTQLTVSNIRKSSGGQLLEAGDEVKFFIGSGNVQSNTTTDTFTMTVKPIRDVALDTANPTDGKVGENYSYTFTAVGMGYMKHYAMPTAEIPDGLTLSPDGVLSGVPITAGVYTFTVEATDIGTTVRTDSHEYTMTISEADVPTISSDSELYEGEIGYSKVLINLENDTFLPSTGPIVSFIYADGSNASSSYGWERISDTQFSINDINRDYASLKAGDKVSIYFQAFALAGGTMNTNTITLTVQPTRPVTLDKADLELAVMGESYTHTFLATGGKGYKTFNVTSGALPEGIQLYASGYLNGTPTTAGQYTFTITATDGSTPADTDSYEYTLNVKAKTVSGDYKYADGVIYDYTGDGGDIIIPSEIDGIAITAIGARAFSDNTSIKSVKISNSIKTIGNYAFYGCTNLKSIVIPESVTSIKTYAFGQIHGLSSLGKAIFLGDAPNMESNVFRDATQDFKVYYLSDKTGYSVDWGGYTCEPFDLTSTYNITYNGNDNDGGTAPTDSAVYHTSETATVLSSDVSKTGYSFKCWNTKADGTGEEYTSGDLLTVGVENVTLYAQWNKTYTITKDSSMKNGSLSVWVEGKEVSAAKAYEYVTIKIEPAEGYRYTEGTLRYHVEGEEDYYYINNMPGPMGPIGPIVDADDDSNTIGFMMNDENIVITADFEPTTNDYSVYDMGGGYGGISKYFGAGGNLIIPSKINDMNIIGISGDVFLENSSLTGVTLPEGLIYTGPAVFAGCDSLSAVVLPDSLEQIGSYCFADCTMLKSIVIPSKVKTIGYYAFSDSDMLTSICFEGDAVPDNWDYAFDGTNADLVICYKEGAQGFDAALWPNHTLKEYKYLVKYNDNGATSGIVPSEHILFADGSIQTKANSGTLVKTGYTFNGWNTKADGTGTNYAVGATANVTGDMVLYAKWTSVSNENNTGGGGGSSKPVTTPTTPTISTTTTVEAKSDESGKATAAVTEKQVTDAVAQAQLQGEKTVTIKVDAPSGAKSVETSIPKASMASMAENMSEGMNVSTPVATLTFDNEALKTIVSGATGDVKINVAKVETSTLSEETKQLVGDRPVYNFSVTSGDKTISQFGGNVTVSVPYTPAENEDTNSLVIYYINAEGKTEMVKDCVYDKATGMITFKTNHFSKYAVGYNKVDFKDVSGWYEDSVMYLASKNIIKGKSEGYFVPNANITRAEFVQILANMAVTDLSQYTTSNFSDVNTNDWFNGAVVWANENGIASGADGKFNPNADITRQDMAVMLNRYVENVVKADLAATTNAVEFADETEVADYAKTAVTTMQQAGIIAGKGNNEFMPKANATRAEAAKMIASVMQSSIN